MVSRHSPWCLAIVGAGLFGSPAIAQTPSLQQLVEVANISGVSASPDGRSIVFRVDRASVDRNTVDLQWWRLDVASGRLSPLDGGGEPMFVEPGTLFRSRPIWSPDSRAIFYPALRGGEVQIYRTWIDGFGTRRVTSEEGDVTRLDVQTEPGQLRYRVGPPRAEILRTEQEAYDEGVVVDAHVQMSQSVHQGALINGRRATQRLSGDWMQRGNILWERPDRIRTLDLRTLATADTGETAPSVPSSRGEGGPAVVRPGDGFRVRSVGGSAGLEAMETGALSSGSGDGSAAGSGHGVWRCREEICASSRFRWLQLRPGQDQVVFATADDSLVMSLHIWHVRSGRVRRLVASQAQLSGDRRRATPCAVSADAIYCVEASPGNAPRLVRFAIESGRRDVVYDPNANYRASMTPRVEPLRWQSAGGRTFHGYIFSPATTARGPTPLFISYYICEGFMRESEVDEWPFEYYAASGITAVCVTKSSRGGPQDSVASYRDALDGLTALIDRLASSGQIDRRHVGIGGLSFGSEVAVWGVRNSSLFSAAAMSSPSITPATYWAAALPGRDYRDRVRDAWGLGTPDETPERWRIVSPVFDVERVQAPILMQMPEQEARFTSEFLARLEMAGRPSELVVFPDERHLKFLPRHRLASMRRNLDWFRFWLQGHEDPDPTRASQYRRWRDLAERWRRIRASRSGEPQPPQERSQSSMETRSSTR